MIISRLVVPTAVVSLLFAAVACGTQSLGGDDGSDDGDGGEGPSPGDLDAAPSTLDAGDATARDAAPTPPVTDATTGAADGGDAGDASNTGDGAPVADATPDASPIDITWSAQDLSSYGEGLRLIGGSGPGDVYVAGTTILHSTGNGAWTLEPSPQAYVLNNFATLGAGRMFVGYQDGIMARDPSTATWSLIGACTSPNAMPGAIATGGQVAVAGFHAYTSEADSLCTFDDLVDVEPGGVDGGGRVIDTYGGASINAVFASTTGPTYALGYGPNGSFASYAVKDGWAALTVPADAPLLDYGAAYGNTMWALSGNALYKSTNYGPLALEQTFPSAEYVDAIWAGGEDDVWMSASVDNSTCELLHLQGGALTRYSPPGAVGPCYAIWGASPTEIYALSGTYVLLHAKF